MKLRSDIPPSVFRVFVAVLALAAAGKPVTVRGLARRLGVKSPNSIKPPLDRLRAAGFVEWEEKPGRVGNQRGPGGTIRPLRRLELIEG